MSGYLLGVEIGGTKLQLVVGTTAGAIVERKRLQVKPENRAAGIQSQIERHLLELIRDMRDSGAVFPFLRPESAHATITTFIRRASALVGDAEAIRYSAHSLRAGFAMAAYRSGVPLEDITLYGRWSSVDMLRRYLRHEILRSPLLLGSLADAARL
jgi:integrase